MASKTPTQILADVDNAIKYSSTVVMYVHKVSSGATTPAGYEITGDNYTAVMDGIKSRVDKGLIDAVTAKEWFDGLSGSRAA